MPKPITDGKITYIHGALPPVRDQVREMLEAAELSPEVYMRFPSEGVQVRPIPIIDGFSPIGMPDEPSVEVFYGGPAAGNMPPAEPDEYEIWATGEKRAASRSIRVNWQSAAMWIAIILMCTMAWLGIAGIIASIRLQDFLATPPSTTSITPK